MNLLSMALNALQILVIARVIISWVRPAGNSGFVRVVYELTEPLLKPIRQLLPNTGGIDFSPLVLFFIISFARSILHF